MKKESMSLFGCSGWSEFMKKYGKPFLIRRIPGEKMYINVETLLQTISRYTGTHDLSFLMDVDWQTLAAEDMNRFVFGVQNTKEFHSAINKTL